MQTAKTLDQTGRIPTLIRVFAGHTCHFVCFVMRQLICKIKCENVDLNEIKIVIRRCISLPDHKHAYFSLLEW